MERDDGICQECGGQANEVDHIVPIMAGGDPDGLPNLQALCTGCHVLKTAADRRRYKW